MREEPLFVFLRVTEKLQVVQKAQEATTTRKSKNEILELTEQGTRHVELDRPVP